MAPYMFCRVCRINHDKGKGHKYGVKHKQYLTEFLSKSRTKIQDISSSLKEVAVLQDEGRGHTKFWCSFCELEVDENESAFARESAIQHLGSPSHFSNVKIFLLEQGAGVTDSHRYCISKEELLKWQERCKVAARTTSKANVELFRTNNIHSDTSHNDPGSSLALDNRQTVLHIASVDDVQPLSVLTVGSSQRHLPMYDGASSIHGDQLFFSTSGATEASRPSSNGWGGGTLHYMDPGSRSTTADFEASTSKSSHDYYPETPNGILNRSIGVTMTPYTQARGAHLSATNMNSSAHYSMRSLPVAAVPQHTVMATGQALSKIVCPPLQPGEGNVHSGGPPPWIGPGDDKQLFSASSIDMEAFVKTQPLSKTQERKLAKLRPPNRVGAAWAEMRRAQLERAARGETVPEADASWLPNFGRVWQSGSRHDTRKEFEAEKRREAKRLGRPLGKRGATPLEIPHQVYSNREENPRHVQPYVSKRQRNG